MQLLCSKRARTHLQESVKCKFKIPRSDIKEGGVKTWMGWVKGTGGAREVEEWEREYGRGYV